MRIQTHLNVLVFELGGQTYGVPSSQVKTLVRAAALSRLPKAPAIVEGVLNLHGAVVPVLDIRARFRLPNKPLEHTDHYIVATIGQRVVALRVDRVMTLTDVDAEAIQDDIPGAEYLAGVAKLPDGLVLIHDLTTFLTAAEAASLDALREHGKEA